MLYFLRNTYISFKSIDFPQENQQNGGVEAAQGRQEEICENPGRPDPYGFLLNSLRNIAILRRPKGGPHERLQEGEGSSGLREAKMLYFLRKYNKREDGQSKILYFYT